MGTAGWGSRASSWTALCLLIATPAVAFADWPMARHDPSRTGSAPGKGDLATPAVYWKTFLGGGLGADALRAVDVDGNGVSELVYVSGGVVACKRADDELLWRSPPLDLRSLNAVADLDGDGQLDVVVSSTNHVWVLNAATGSIEWAEPDGEMGTIDAVRVGDLTGDGKPEVVIQECGCCAVASGATGVVYSFSGGFGSASLLYTLPWKPCAGGRSLTMADVDGTGPLELVTADQTHFGVLDGTTGTVLAETSTLGTWVARSRCRPADLDGAPGEELLCILNSSDPPSTNQRRVFALGYASSPPTFKVLWDRVVAPDAGGDVAYSHPLVDLDGDGKLEVVVSSRDAKGVWSTSFFDAASGAPLTSRAGERIAGIASLGASGGSLTLTSVGTDLIASAYTTKPAPETQLRWSLADRAPRLQPDWSYSSRCELADEAVVTDLNGDGVGDLVASSRSDSSELYAYSAATGSPVPVGSIKLPTGVDPSAAWILPPVTKPYPQLAVARTDGFLTIYDTALSPTNSQSASLPGAAVGGYYAPGGWRDLQRPPVTASLDGSKSEQVVIVNGRGALVRLDASAASLASPPKKRWEKTHTFAPVVVPGIANGSTGIAAFGLQEPLTDPPTYSISVLEADGATLWTRQTESAPLNDLVPGRFDSDGIPDLVFQWGDPGDVLLRTRALSGADGQAIWNSIPIDPGAGRQPSGVAVADWNGDGIDDVIFQGGATRVLGGVDGAQIASGGPTSAYFLPTVYDVDGDGVAEVTLHGGLNPARTLTHSLSGTVWSGSEDDRPYPYGAIAVCPGGAVLVEGSLQFPARLKTTRISGSSAGTYSAEILADGAVYPDAGAATAAGKMLGVLTSAAVHQNLTGKGRPTAVVGSSDGWLYGVNPCNGLLDFAVSFPAAVGTPVFGDTDGDGKDEVIVTVANGYLYDIKNSPIAAPSFAWDVDPAHGVTDVDVDDIDTTDSLSGKWGTVSGASSYEVAVVDSAGNFVTAPPWQSAGTATQLTLSGLTLADDEKYRWAVRAVSASGVSIDTVSDGVHVHLPKLDGGTDAGVDASDDAVADADAAGADAASEEPGTGAEPPEDAGDTADEQLVSGRACTCRSGSAPAHPTVSWIAAGAAAVVARLRRRRCRLARRTPKPIPRTGDRASM